MADALQTAVMAVSVLNLALALVLAVLYARVYARTKAPFTLGLILFAIAFLGQNALMAYAYGTMMPLFDLALTPYLLGVTVLEAVGLAAVAWTATR